MTLDEVVLASHYQFWTLDQSVNLVHTPPSS